MPEFRLSIVTHSIAAALAFGCSQAAQRPACAPERLAEIEAGFVTEVTFACEGYTLATCPRYREIDAHYDALREEWIQCR